MLILSKSNAMGEFLISGFIFGIGFGAVQASLQAMAVIRAPKDRLGAANATFYTGFDGGMGVGSVAGGLLASYIGYGNMFLFISISLLMAGILFFVSNRFVKQEN